MSILKILILRARAEVDRLSKAQGEANQGAPTFPEAADYLGTQADGAIVLAVGIDAHLWGKDAGMQHVLHLAVGVYIAGQYLQRVDKRGGRSDGH